MIAYLLGRRSGDRAGTRGRQPSGCATVIASLLVIGPVVVTLKWSRILMALSTAVTIRGEHRQYTQPGGSMTHSGEIQITRADAEGLANKLEAMMKDLSDQERTVLRLILARATASEPDVESFAFEAYLNVKGKSRARSPSRA